MAAFSSCSKLSSITLPKSVIDIGEICFKECCNLSSITIPESVTSIGLQCFCGCSSLTSLTIHRNTYNSINMGNLCLQEGCIVNIIENDSEKISSVDTSVVNNLKVIVEKYISICKHNFIKPTKPDIQSVNDNFIKETLIKLDKITNAISDLDNLLSDLDSHFVEHNKETKDVLDLIHTFNSI